MKTSLLKVERKLREWSQAELAEALGVSTKTVSRWEQGQAIPHPYYRDKLQILFGKTAEELGLQEDINENSIVQVSSPILQSTISDIPMRPLPLFESHIEESVNISINSQEYKNTFIHLDEQKISLIKENPTSEQNLWEYRRNMLSFRFSNHIFSDYKFFSKKRRLLILVVIATILLPLTTQLLLYGTHITISSQKHPTPTNTSIKENSGPSSYKLTIINTNPSLLNVSQHFKQAFDAVYPQLVNRFVFDPHSVKLQNVTLTFSSQLTSPAATSDPVITISSNWIHQHPTDIGLLTHELTLLVEQYPHGAPRWFASGMADYARSVYGPADDDNWSLPNAVQPQNSYTQGGTVTARFLLWLEQHTRLDIVDQLNYALQTGQHLPDAFQRLTHQTIDGLWKQYQAHPDITLTLEQVYKTVISRKPLYQSPLFHVRLGEWHTLKAKFVPNLYMSNFAMQTDMTVNSGNGVAGFIFRNENSASYYLRLGLDGTYGIMDQTQLLTSGFSPIISQGLHHTNQLTIIVQKHSIYLYINGQLITEVNTRGSSYGTLGVMAIDETKVTDVNFTNLKIF